MNNFSLFRKNCKTNQREFKIGEGPKIRIYTINIRGKYILFMKNAFFLEKQVTNTHQVQMQMHMENILQKGKT